MVCKKLYICHDLIFNQTVNDNAYSQKGTDVVVNSIADDVWFSEDEVTGVLSDRVESYYWLCL